MILDTCNCGCCSLRTGRYEKQGIAWICRGEPACTTGSPWKHCPFCGSPLANFAVYMQKIVKAANQFAEDFQDFSLRILPYVQKVYEAAKAQGLLDDKEAEDDAD